MNRIRFPAPPRPRRAVLPALLCAALTGCGPGQGEVSGTVRYNGKPLPFGTIQFLGSDGLPHAGQIRPDGTYSVRVPGGEARALVSCVDEARLNRVTSPATGSRGRAAPPAPGDKTLSLIPPRYADWGTSGLTVRVDGQTTRDFTLTPN